MTDEIKNRLDRLDRELQSLLEELKAHSDERLNRAPAAGAWSPLQVMHHLLMAEGLSLKYLEKKLSYEPQLKRAGLMTAWREWLLVVYLRTPLKFKAPANVDESKFPADLSLGPTAETWLKQRRRLREFLGSLPETRFREELYRHPFAGRLTLDGMLLFFEDHFRRHRKQIRRALNGQTS